jgi:hypothetical protein
MFDAFVSNCVSNLTKEICSQCWQLLVEYLDEKAEQEDRFSQYEVQNNCKKS